MCKQAKIKSEEYNCQDLQRGAKDGRRSVNKGRQQDRVNELLVRDKIPRGRIVKQQEALQERPESELIKR